MPPKADKLSQTIESLQLFLAKRAEEREDLSDIARQLTQFNKILRQKKLTVQIVSADPTLAQAVFDLIDAEAEFKRVFQLKFDRIPQPPQQTAVEQTASLKLRQNMTSGTGLQQYIELKPQQEYTVGRSPHADIAIDPKLYQGVSWDHAIIQAIGSNSNLQWQIGDRQSTNGTFVNGRRVTNTQLLNSGDTITLACPQTGQMVAELAFTIRMETPDLAADREYWEAVDCDLLIVVADSKQPLSDRIREFITNLDRTYISQQYLLLDTPDPKQEPEIAKMADENLRQIETWVKGELNSAGWELAPLYLQPFYDEDAKANIDPRQQKKQERLIKTLANLVKRQPENILAKRIAVKVVRAAEPIEPLLEQQQQELKEKLERERQELSALSQTNLKETSKRAIAEAHQTKDRFFKQTKLDLAQSKAALLDIYSKRSVVYQIQDFVDGLTPVVSTKNNQKIIRLDDDDSDSDDINTSLVEFCTESLEKWANEEWYRINHTYGDGGLQGLQTKLKQKIAIAPDILSASPFSQPEKLDVRAIFQMSFAGTHCETTHQQKSLGAYIMKQLRSQMMQVMMMLTLVLGFAGFSLSKTDMIQSLSSKFKEYPWLFGIFVCVIIFLLVSAYNNENDQKLEEVGVKLKKDLSGYYQSFSKNLLEKVIQDINFNLELEDKKIADGLDIVSEAYSDRSLEVENKQARIKNNLEKYQEQQKSLATELAEFEKLKKM